MENQNEVIYAVRENNQSHYDKRLILKIVKEVERGLPRKFMELVKPHWIIG